ncbi:aminoglycoside phosphotransferase family protein [Ferdinandcohnia sp. Marseille-Q9671]
MDLSKVEKADNWYRRELEYVGLQFTGKIERVKESDFSIVERISTDCGDVYFKANGQATRHEAALSKHLNETSFGKTARIISSNEVNGWLLMEDLGGTSLRSIKDKRIWQQALQEYAELQVTQISYVDNLIYRGVPDRRIPKLKSEVEQHLRDMSSRLSTEEAEKILSLQKEILKMCDELYSIVPSSIEHGDLHSNNIRVVDNNILFFDWGDASISHPFFSTRIFWHALDDLIEKESEWLAIVDEFRPYYLEPWLKFATMKELDEALRISDELACIQRALSWYIYLTQQVDRNERPAQWLRLFLEHRTLIGK